ncbi:MAG: LamG-like jellyroll fold domain-containing protein [Candidatus Sumerlaeia bacterium]
MMKKIACMIAILLIASMALGADFKWQEPQAIVTETGAIKWNPRPLVEDFSGQDLRYIDFEGGNDANDGTSPQSAWKHHPWDPFAEGKAKACSGPKTYIFKRGVVYRNTLRPFESGTPEKPIRLTSSEKWGEGQAYMWGSITLPAEWEKLTASGLKPPKYMEDLDTVWVMKLDEMEWWNNGRPGRNAHVIGKDAFHFNRTGVDSPWVGLFTVKEDGSREWNHLARDPDWQPAGNEYAHDYWHSWDGEGKPLVNEKGETYFQTVGPFKGPAMDDYLKGKPQDYFTGAYFWTTWPSLMGGATPKKIPEKVFKHKSKEISGPAYDPEQGAIALLQMRGFSKGTSYKIENLPQYMDTPGEFYLDHDRKEKRSILYMRFEPGVDPNKLQIEMAANRGNIYIRDANNIEISGLEFRYTQGYAVEISGQCENIAVRNCVFRDLTKYAIDSEVAWDFAKWTEKNKNIDPEEWKLEQPDNIIIADNEFHDIWDQTIRLDSGASGSKSWPFGHMKHIEVLRNYLQNVGIRHSGTIYSAIPAIWVHKPETGIIAGNVIKKSFGSGILVHGGQTNGYTGSDWPLTRILIYHNSTEDTALAVNDYGGFSLWQGGQMYAYNNNIGNSVGYISGGLFGSGRPITLSYPYYIDGGYKIYGFNNIVWDRSNDPDDPYSSNVAGYFSVFGFLNHFTNNTLYRHARAAGGSSGNRTDIISNVFADINREFLKNNRVENPSLVGGGDTGASGIQGVPSLAYGRNIFQGEAVAGELVADNEDRGIDVPVDIKADTIAEMAKQMQEFPVRYGDLGTQVKESPILGELEKNGLTEKGSEAADFRLTQNSPAIDAGATYFIPWALGATVGEWNFTENRAKPTVLTDYALYMSEAHFQRFMYNQVPTLNLKINQADLDDYVESPSEDWVNGAVSFDGSRYATVTDAEMREDIKLHIRGFITGHGQRSWSTWKKSVNREVWKIPEPEGGFDGRGNPNFGPDQVARYPGERRNTLISKTRNLLVEVKFKTEAGHTDGALLNKMDGNGGYGLFINGNGQAEFTAGASGRTDTVQTMQAVNDGQWHHVLAEFDRATGRMTIYLDGKQNNETKSSIPASASLDCKADFVVGKKSWEDAGYLKGAIDFMRVCHATLEDSKTSIEELYAWQYINGPALFDMRGQKPMGERRDAGALERQ